MIIVLHDVINYVMIERRSERRNNPPHHVCAISLVYMLECRNNAISLRVVIPRHRDGCVVLSGNIFTNTIDNNVE